MTPASSVSKYSGGPRPWRGGAEPLSGEGLRSKPRAAGRRRQAAKLLALLTLAACATQTEPEVSVRHVASTQAYGTDGARLHLFIFDPLTPRSLETRKRIARATIARETGCTWIDAPDAFLASETAKQGARYADTMLVAPLRCRA